MHMQHDALRHDRVHRRFDRGTQIARPSGADHFGRGWVRLAGIEPAAHARKVERDENVMLECVRKPGSRSLHPQAFAALDRRVAPGALDQDRIVPEFGRQAGQRIEFGIIKRDRHQWPIHITTGGSPSFTANVLMGASAAIRMVSTFEMPSPVLPCRRTTPPPAGNARWPDSSTSRPSAVRKIARTTTGFPVGASIFNGTPTE